MSPIPKVRLKIQIPDEVQCAQRSGSEASESPAGGWGTNAAAASGAGAWDAGTQGSGLGTGPGSPTGQLDAKRHRHESGRPPKLP